jgi:hypothetical protein
MHKQVDSYRSTPNKLPAAVLVNTTLVNPNASLLWDAAIFSNPSSL